MEVSGNNRYELLFMDDEGSTPTLVPRVVSVTAKKKQPGVTAGTATTAVQSTNKKANAEKENKSSALNKNIKTVGAGSAGLTSRSKQSPEAGGKNRNRPYGASNSTGEVLKVQGGGERYENRGNRRSTRENGPGSNEYSNENQLREPRQFRDRDGRGPPRNRYGENSFRGGKREFDRQSGSDKTGVKAVDKRDGAGAHNWGSVKQEIEDINKSTTEEATLTDKEESANEQSVVEQGNVLEEEETKEMTLDEWKAMRQQRAKPQYNLRKAGEGEDTTQWKKMIVLNKNKKKEGSNSDDEEFEYDPSMYPQRVGRLQRIVNIQFNFNDSRRVGGGYGRGRGRGPRPGGDKVRFEGGEDSQGDSIKLRNKPQRASTNALKVDDERQFPTLS